MFKALKFTATAVVLIPFVTVAAILLFWLGRPEEEVGEVVTAEFDPDDPGEEVDGE